MKNALYLILAVLVLASASAQTIYVRPSYASSGREEEIFAKVLNQAGNDDLEDVQMTLMIPDLNIYEKTSNFDVNDAESSSHFFMVDFDDLAPGYYPIRISVEGQDSVHVKWTWIAIE